MAIRIIKSEDLFKIEKDVDALSMINIFRLNNATDPVKGVFIMQTVCNMPMFHKPTLFIRKTLKQCPKLKVIPSNVLEI